MRRYFYLFLISFLSLRTIASEDSLPNTLLWKIEGSGLTKPSYLYGTMHVADDAAFGLMDSVLIAFKACEKYAMEVNPDSLDESALAGEVLLPEGTTLRNLLSPSDYELVKKECWKRLHIPMFILDRIKPFYIMVMLMEGLGDSKKVLDMYFVKLAKKQGKPVHGLEDPMDQLAMLDDISLEKQSAMLVESVKDGSYDSQMDSLLIYYANRDLNKMYSLVRSDTTFGEEFMKKMLDDRNEVMAEEIIRLAKISPVFAAVGAAHLPGEEGVIERLKRKGYRVSPVISSNFLKPKYVKKQAK